MRSFAHRQRMQQSGYRRREFVGKPVIGIINTWSDLSPCHSHFRNEVEFVKRGVLQAGGFPVELPAMSLGEVLVKPTTMLYRNFLACETEELIWSHPIDGAVLMGGCDKTTPGLLMGVFSLDIPAIFLPAGAMSSGAWRGERVGAGTHTKKFWNERRAGKISGAEWLELETVMTRTAGTCNTMGTASTMTSLVDIMGLTMPGASSIPAVDAEHGRMAAECGEQIVSMVSRDRRPSSFVTRRSFLNAVSLYMSLGGSTNACIHLIAMARRLGLELSLADFEEASDRIPVLANLFPNGEFLMDDFYFCGGIHALAREITDSLFLGEKNVTGESLGAVLERGRTCDGEVIRSAVNPVRTRSAVKVLRGNLCPDGAIVKASAADERFWHHVGAAIVFDNYKEMADRIDDPDLNVDENSVLVLRNSGPVGAPGMPEWGNLPIPEKLLRRGVKDMVRISDARMSGTHYGTCILHVCPESAIGGPLAVVRTGDEICLDMDHGTLNVNISEHELTARLSEWRPPEMIATSIYVDMYRKHVTQANLGCDFQFYANRMASREEPEIF